MERNWRQAARSWAIVGSLLLLCAVLGILQYKWIGEVSLAERERLRGSLQASLNRLSIAFNTELANACAALIPRGFPNSGFSEQDYAARFLSWKESSPHEDLFRAFAIVVPENGRLRLRRLNQQKGEFEDFDWPEDWSALKERLEMRALRIPRDPRNARPGPPWGDEGLLIEIPQFGPPPAGPPLGRMARSEIAWLILEVDPETVRTQLLPDLVRRHLDPGGSGDYLVQVVTRDNPPAIIYQSDPAPSAGPLRGADASVPLFDVQMEQIFRRFEMRGGRDPMRARAPAPDRGRWLLIARHRAGSLEAVVAKTRRRNLAVMSAILLLIVASMGALIRFTRRAQRLAQLQMDFVAGVSHELRTPLTVIRTAAYNLRGKLANNPAQVEKYGSLIQQESERLTELVEQVLHFASARAGKVVRPSEPVLLENLIQESLASSRSLIDAARCTVDLQLEPGLPVILGDPVSLKQVFQNLLSNAAKYGAGDQGWIGLSAARDGAAVSIRVADRGPGIPPDEQDLIFEPFFRGRRAIEDQIHGTGLGLNLVKSIVEAHGGTITVKSAPGEGTVFTVRLPAAPQEYQDEFKNLAG